ncbi:hypothetical protein M9Y10_031751 [Tritrichomonas musculus]|uniref:Class I SAM-dependent methyltransferase n=1 Tax=Tritrichomonas musculus TaxID=1915356 RepID=A0ABR2H1B2_9EUKA
MEEEKIQLWSIKFTPYTDCIFPVSSMNSTVVWPRLLSSSEKDTSALFVGYSNLHTEYGDEGVDIFCDTPKCSRTVFFSGDELDYNPEKSNEYSSKKNLDDEQVGQYTECWIPKNRVDQNKYNHLYGDFRSLRKDFSYLINCEFFDYIFIGDRTFIYFSSIDILTDFCSMLKKGGSLLIALNDSSLIYYYGPSLDDFFGYEYEIIPYFYSAPAQNEQILSYILHNSRSIFSDFRYNSVKDLEDDLSEIIPFASNFFEQNQSGSSPLHNGKESLILKIYKK